jgi:hypothetical protein
MFKKRTKAVDHIGTDIAGSAISRRRLFGTGAAMGVGMAAGGSLLRPGTAQAAQGDAVLLGMDVSGATHRTGLFSTTGEVAVLNDPGNDGGTPGSVGVWGIGHGSGVYGNAVANSGGTGVAGIGDGTGAGGLFKGGSAVGKGVEAFGAPGVLGHGYGSTSGVVGISGDTYAGVAGYCDNAEGVYARSGQTDSTNAGISRSGVHGVTDSATASGVWGEALNGGAGVTGTASGNNGGVQGLNAGAGPGVLAQNTGSGPALGVVGPAVFNRSGVLTVAINKSSVTLSGISLGAASLVLATVQGSVAGIYVQGVTVVSGSSGSFTIHLNKATTKALKVGWFVVN